MSVPFTPHISSDIPSLDGKLSDWVLAIVVTPSSVHWDIVRYDASYKGLPWRTVSNHGVNIITYYNLPELPNELEIRRSA